MGVSYNSLRYFPFMIEFGLGGDVLVNTGRVTVMSHFHFPYVIFSQTPTIIKTCALSFLVSCSFSILMMNGKVL